MDYSKFKKICQWIHNTVDTEHFTFDDCMSVLTMYFDAYNDFMGHGHQVPSHKQIVDAMQKMPYADPDRTIPLESEDYRTLVPAYFLIDFQNCDYGISHFFSGEIRMNRYYETLY